MRSPFTFALALVLGYSLPVGSFAQEVKAADTKPAETKQEPPKRDQKALDYEKAIKDLKRVDGPFPMYQRKKDILVEIGEDQLDKLFLVQSTFATGFGANLQAGDPVFTDEASFSSIMAFAFEKKDEELWLIRPNIKYRWSKDDPLAGASARSFPRAYLTDYRIEQSNPETKKLLVNMTAFFNGEVTNLNMLVALMAQRQFAIDRDKSGVDAIYANNDMTVVRMNAHYTSPLMAGGGGNPFAALMGGANQWEDPRSLPLQVNYTIWWRKPSNYMPRQSDPRVGYFTTDFYSVDKFMSPKMDRTERYINRWGLEKKDPKAAMSEPVKPIVWTLDTSIPAKYRPAVREGILRWNKAFEALGYKNAVQVVDAPKDDPNYNHADGTRNVVRFTMSEDSAYAVALFRTDPFTGEILNAAVTVDANFPAFVNQEHSLLAAPNNNAFLAMVNLAKTGWKRTDEAEPTPREVLLDTYKYRDQKLAKLRPLGWSMHQCDLVQRRGAEMGANFAAAKAAGLNMSSDEYVNGYLADTVAHEIGHCMGLRHNFVSSATLTTAELADPACVKQYGVAASVMDYTPTNSSAMLAKRKDLLWNSSVGPYDVFAIKYGYTDKAGQTPEGEKYVLGQIARMNGQKGLGFMTDEDADGFDPSVQRFDCASDSINYSLKEMELGRMTQNWAMTNLPRAGESYAWRNRIVLGSINRRLNECLRLTAFVGGLVGNRNFKGDVNQKPTLAPVPAAQQRLAMQTILRESLGTSALGIPEAELTNLGMDYNTDGSGYTAPINRMMLMPRMMALAELMSAARADFILENATKTGFLNAYTLEEHYRTLIGAIFTEVSQGGNITPMRRELQDFCVEGLMMQSVASTGDIPADLRRVAGAELARVHSQIKSQLSHSSKLHASTVQHLTSLSERIERFNKRIRTGA